MDDDAEMKILFSDSREQNKTMVACFSTDSADLSEDLCESINKL